MRLALSPTYAGYSGEFPGALTTTLDGPKGGYRKDVERNPIEVSASFVVDQYGFQYLRSFFRGPAYKGAAPFTVGLALEDQAVSDYTAWFIPGSFALAGIQGAAYTVTVQMEVIPQPANDAYDASLFAVGQAFGESAVNGLALLDSLVNSAWPAA